MYSREKRNPPLLYSLEKASVRPSGDHAGREVKLMRATSLLDDEVDTSTLAPDPSAFMTWTLKSGKSP